MHSPTLPEVLTEASGIPDDSVRDFHHRVCFVVPRNHDDLTWYMKLDWILYNITLPVSVIVTAVFFSMLYPEISHPTHISLFNLHQHALNTVFSLLDFSVSSMPTRLVHVIYPLFYGLVYVVFTVCFWVKDHDDVIYPHVLDWDYWVHSLVLVILLAVVVLPILQVILFVLYKIRVALYRRYCWSFINT